MELRGAMEAPLSERQHDGEAAVRRANRSVAADSQAAYQADEDAVRHIPSSTISYERRQALRALTRAVVLQVRWGFCLSRQEGAPMWLAYFGTGPAAG